MFDRIKQAYRAFKDVPFERAGGASGVQVIYPNMNSLQEAILRAISPQQEPSDDPHVSALVHAGITWLANTLPEPDLHVKKGYLRKREGKSREDEVVERHPLYSLFDRPNPYTSGSTLWRAFAYSWIIRGNVYFLKFRNEFGQVIQIWYEPHFNVIARWRGDKQGEYIPAEQSRSVASIERNDNDDRFINYYEIARGGTRFRVEPADVIHFRDGLDPFSTRYGISRIHTILRDIYGDSAAANYASSLLGGNSVIPYVLGIDDPGGTIGPQDLIDIKARLLEQTTGKNAGQPLVITSRSTFNRTGLTPKEMDLRTSRYMAQEVFSQVTGIPPQVLNFGAGLERSIYNNMREADRRAVDQYLQPLWWHIAQELTHQLLRDLDQDETHFVEFDLSEVGALQKNENEVWERIGKAYQDGLLKRAEARKEVGYEPAEDGSDDVYFSTTGSETVSVEQEKVKRERSIEAAKNPPEPNTEPRQLTEGPLRIAR